MNTIKRLSLALIVVVAFGLGFAGGVATGYYWHFDDALRAEKRMNAEQLLRNVQEIERLKAKAAP